MPNSRARIAAEPVSDVATGACRRQRLAGRYGPVLVDAEVSAGAIEVEGVAGVVHVTAATANNV